MLLPCGHCSEFSGVTDAFSDLAIISKGKGSGEVDAFHDALRENECLRTLGVVV